jgi:hypothetical protein
METGTGYDVERIVSTCRINALERRDSAPPPRTQSATPALARPPESSLSPFYYGIGLDNLFSEGTD